MATAALDQGVEVIVINPDALYWLVKVLPEVTVNALVLNFAHAISLPDAAAAETMTCRIEYMIEPMLPPDAVNTESAASNLICFADAPAVTTTLVSAFDPV